MLATGVKWWETREEPPERSIAGRKRKPVIADQTYLDVLEKALLKVNHEHP